MDAIRRSDVIDAIHRMDAIRNFGVEMNGVASPNWILLDADECNQAQSAFLWLQHEYYIDYMEQDTEHNHQAVSVMAPD